MKQLLSSLAETPKEFKGLSRARYEWVKAVVKGEKVLELGSGLGEGAVWLASHGAKKVVGIDYAVKAVVEAKRRLDQKKKLEFKQMNALEIDKLKERFGVIVAFELLEHLDEQEQRQLVRLMKKRLKPGGRVIVSTPNRLVFSKGRQRSRYPFHKHELTVKELIELFESEFKQVRVKGIRCVNQEHVRQKQELEAGWWHRMIEWWAGFGWVHQILPWLSQSLKGWVTGEGKLVELKKSDFKLSGKGVEECGDLWLEARV